MKMNKLSFTVLIILICLISCLFTCKPYEGEEVEYEYTNVVYSENLNSVTIYLDGQVSVPRSLNTGIAKMGCDYFEVTFLYRSPTDEYIVARGEWRAGRMASVSGVEMNGTTGTGVNYDGVTKTPASGSGSAILFAGKSDKTLLAIGRLTGVNGLGSKEAPVTLITTNTKSVTFTISAITAGVSSTLTNSSFRTNTNNPAGDVNIQNTKISTERIFHTVAKDFQVFQLEQKKQIKAEYTFTLATGGNSAFDFSQYTNGIFISNPSAPNFGAIIPGFPLDQVEYTIERKQPRYTTYDSNGKPIDTYHNSILMLDEKTVITLENNRTAHLSFEPVVRFTFDTENTINGTLFSLVFSIPVYAMSEYDDNGIRSRWYIRSGYGPSLYDLDDGTSGMGGAVLLGTGRPDKAGEAERTIRIQQTPNKWLYTAAGERILDISGLIVVLETKAVPPIFIENVNYNGLVFKVGQNDKSSRKVRWTANPAAGYEYTRPASILGSGYYTFPSDFYGIIEIVVEYYDAPAKQTYYDSFYVLVSNDDHPFDNIPTSQIAHIYNDNTAYPEYTGLPAKPAGSKRAAWDTFTGYNNINPPTLMGQTIANFSTAWEKFQFVVQNSPNNRTVIIVLHESFNIPSLEVNSVEGIPRLFMVIAADDDSYEPNNSVAQIIMGRGGTAPALNRIQQQHSSAGLNAWYFGTWPFRGTPGGIGLPNFPFNISTNTHHTKGYTVNTGGAGNANLNPIPSNTWKLLTDNRGSAPGYGIYNVKVNGAVIKYPELLH